MKNAPWIVLALAGVLFAGMALFAVVAAAGFAGMGGGGSQTSGGSLSGACNYDDILNRVASGKALGESTAHNAPQQVPSQYIPYYQDAADKHQLGGCGAAILAGIHSIESGFGGDSYATVNSAGAGGPFQFLQSTWDSESQPPGGCGGTWPGYGVSKGACAAANYLKNSGAPKDWVSAIYAYNHADWYVYGVVLQAKHFSSQTGSVNAASQNGSATNQPGSKT